MAMLTSGLLLWIIAGILGLFGVLAVASKKDRVLGTSKWLVAIPLVVGSVLIVTMQLGLLAQWGIMTAGVQVPAGAGVITPLTTTTGVPCTVEDTTVTFSSIDKYTAQPSGGYHRYRVNSGPAKVAADAGTDTLSPGDKLSVLFGNETSETYFGISKVFTIPCVGTWTTTNEDKSPIQTIQNGTLTINVFNEEGNLITSSENETLAAGDVVNLKIEIRATDKKGFPHGGIFTVDLNGTEFDEENTKLIFNDLTTQKVATPAVHTVSDVEDKTISFEVPAFEGATLHTGTLTLDVSDKNPGGDNDDPSITFRPKDYFVNEDEAGSFGGPSVEDEDNAATFGHATLSTIGVE